MADTDSEREPTGIWFGVEFWAYSHPRFIGLLRAIAIIAIIVGFLVAFYFLENICGSGDSGGCYP